MSLDSSNRASAEASAQQGLPLIGGSAKLPAGYTAADLQQVQAIEDWLAANKVSKAWLARTTRLSNGTVSSVLKLKYPSPPAALLQQMMAVIQVENDRQNDGTPGYVEGSVHKLVFVVCDRTRKHRNFGVLVGNVGVGKTRTLVEYAVRKPQTVLIEANPQMTPGTLLTELLDQLHVPVPGGLDKKLQASIKALKGTNYLILADEAETMLATSLHYLRRIRDKAQVGVVFCGTSELHKLIKPLHGQFEQIRSRVSMWPQTIQGISRDDMDDMARMALADAPGELADEVLDALWAYSDGSARVLTESLVPALRDYGYGRGALTAKLVHSIAKTVLFMEPRLAQGGA
jgi:hypothetical protein